MLNKYPLWKYLVVLSVLVLATVFAIPNLYPPDPAVQITSAKSGENIPQSVIDGLKETLKENQIALKSVEEQKGTFLLRLLKDDDQLKAKELIQAKLGHDYIVALNLAPTTPYGSPMALGLDLKGGVHFLMEVDMADYLKGRMDNYRDELRTRLREENIRYRRVVLENQQIKLLFSDAAVLTKADSFLSRHFPEFIREQQQSENYHELHLSLNEKKIKELKDYAIKQNLTTIRNRVNELGVAEPLVQRQGSDRIVIELPGVQDTAQAKKILGKAANLEFRLEALPGSSRFITDEFSFRDNPSRTALLEKKIITTGDNVTGAKPAYDENGQPQVEVTLDSAGGARMAQITKKWVKKRSMAVLFIERKPKTVYEMVDGKRVAKTTQITEKSVISLARLAGVFSNRFVITGLEKAESSELALLLRAGALAAPMYFVEERTVGPSLGQENINKGFNSVMLGLALVLIIMVVVYRVFGLVANVALLANLVILVALLSAFGATLTLPGIAGIVLTVGMAVDANVLIFSRIREEIFSGRSPQQAIHEGYDRAFIAIIDANITTLIVAIILFVVGTGPVKGFAVTLSLGVLTSMFTAVMLTRAIVNLIYGGRAIKTLPIGGKKA